MKPLDGSAFFNGIHRISGLAQALTNLPEGASMDWNMDDITELLDVLRQFQKDLNDFGLATSGLAVSRVIKQLEEAPTQLAPGVGPVKRLDHTKIIKLKGVTDQAANRIPDEAAIATMFVLDPRYARLIQPLNHFGDEVFNRFADANDDISEAAACLAVGRGTACVMHLMRVLECGLAAFSAEIGIGPQDNWGVYLREIDAKLAIILALKAPRHPKEQFYSDTKNSMDAMRRAWRNPSMHPEKSYGVERAFEIFEAVRSFMRLLARELATPPS